MVQAGCRAPGPDHCGVSACDNHYDMRDYVSPSLTRSQKLRVWLELCAPPPHSHNTPPHIPPTQPPTHSATPPHPTHPPGLSMMRRMIISYPYHRDVNSSRRFFYQTAFTCVFGADFRSNLFFRSFRVRGQKRKNRQKINCVKKGMINIFIISVH